MKEKLLAALGAALVAFTANAEIVTLGGHKLDVGGFDCKKGGTCTALWKDKGGTLWFVLGKKDPAAFINFIRGDDFKKSRAWIMMVGSKLSTKREKSSLLGVDVDCDSFTTRIVHISIYDDFFCQGETTQTSNEIQKFFVPTPGSPMEAAAGLVCARPK